MDVLEAETLKQKVEDPYRSKNGDWAHYVTHARRSVRPFVHPSISFAFRLYHLHIIDSRVHRWAYFMEVMCR